MFKHSFVEHFVMIFCIWNSRYLWAAFPRIFWPGANLNFSDSCSQPTLTPRHFHAITLTPWHPHSFSHSHHNILTLSYSQILTPENLKPKHTHSLIPSWPCTLTDSLTYTLKPSHSHTKTTSQLHKIKPQHSFDYTLTFSSLHTLTSSYNTVSVNM